MRRNVLNWICGQFKDASHAIVLTHNIDFLFVQSVLLPKLRLSGSPRLTIFADANCASGAYRDQHALIDGLGVRYRVVPVDLGPMRRFHAKAVILSSPQRAMCAIGSGNLTHGGMSANHEAWIFGDSAGEKAALLTSLRDYIQSLATMVPLGKPVQDDMAAVFDPEQTWIAGLPPPSGLVTAPSDQPLLDQIADFVGGEIRAISVLTPYFDPDGKALTEIYRRFSAPVTVGIQPGREGLSIKASAALPKDITLKTVDCLEERRPSFIHAKVIAFHRVDDVVLAIGSANCSQAALLADRNWGNAELMAMDSLTPEAFAEFFGELVQPDEAPNLPADPQSDEWESDVSALRILAARQEGDTLEIAFKSAMPLSNLVVEAREGTLRAAQCDNKRGVAVFAAPIRMRSIELTGQTPTGQWVRSGKTWVDDEASLAAPAGLRRVFRRLQDAESSDEKSADAFRAVLDQFRDYLRDPEVSRRRMRRGEQNDRPLAPYDPAAVFSDDFGKGHVSSQRHTDLSRFQQNILGIVEAIFAVSTAGGRGGEPDYDSGANGEEPDPEIEEQKITRRSNPTPNAKTAAQLRRALEGIEAALVDPSFVTVRRPELLGADIALAAILLVKGLADGHLDIETYRAITKKLWAHLFFGPRGDGTGNIARRMSELDDTARDQFVAAFASPKLSAALVLWSLPEWQATDVDALWFRMSVCQLQNQCFWLFSSAPPDAVMAELENQATLLPPSQREAAIETWVSMVRGGEALRLLFDGLTPISHLELVKVATATEVGPHDLLWQAKALAFPTQHYRREKSVHAEVLLLGQSTPRKFKGDHLVPVRDLLASKVLQLPSRAKAEIERFIEASKGVRGHSNGKATER